MLRKESKSPVTQSRHIVEAYLHEDFEAIHYSSDIAVAKVNKPFIFSTHTMFACLPEESPTPQPSPGATCFAAGWGNTKENRDVVRRPKGPSCKPQSKGPNKRTKTRGVFYPSLNQIQNRELRVFYTIEQLHV